MLIFLASKTKSNFSHGSKPYLVFWELSKHPCFVVETQYHNATSERLLLFLPRVVKHCNIGNKKLSTHVIFYIFEDDRLFYCTLVCYGIQVCLETGREFSSKKRLRHLPSELLHIKVYSFCLSVVLCNYSFLCLIFLVT